MMCCTADRIVASPFAVLGSIGVISEVPNAYERLKQEGIEFQTITAGKYKRTVTPTKKITKEDIKKSEEDIAEIFNLFKSFVKNQRPQLDIESVATGETWFGEDALARGLCDELGTADDVLLDFVDDGYDVYEVSAMFHLHWVWSSVDDIISQYPRLLPIFHRLCMIHHHP